MRTSLTKDGAWGKPQTCKDTPTEQINRLSDNGSDNDRWLQGIIPGLVTFAPYLEQLKEGAYARFGGGIALGDVKMMALGQAYSESPSTAFGVSVQKCAD